MPPETLSFPGEANSRLPPTSPLEAGAPSSSPRALAGRALGKAAVVLPTYQERENIEGALTSLLDCRTPLDVIVVDDSSPDGTGAAARAFGADRAPGRIQVVSRPAKQGLGAAYRHGFTLALDAGYDVIVQMDADGSHPVDAVSTMLRQLEAGHGLVLGSRYVAGGSVDLEWSLARRCLSRAGNEYARRVLRSDVRDLTGGFKAWRADALRAVDVSRLTAAGYAFQIQATIRAVDAGVPVCEVPIHFTERRLGSSKMHAGIIAEATGAVLRLRHERRAIGAPTVPVLET